MNNGKQEVVIIDKLTKDQEFEVLDGEKKTFVIALYDGESISGDVKIIIKGNHADVKILGIVLGFGKQKIDLYTFQDHRKPQSVSDLFIKSVLFDEAKFYYRGLIKIEKDAQKSNAYQKNQNLLIDPNTWADSKPYLEILANDVRCTHGATVGKIDPDQLYYLQTRGLDHDYATELIIEGFLQEVLNRIPDATIMEKLRKRIVIKIQRLLNKRQTDTV